MNDFFKFDKMIAPGIIKVIFAILVILSIVVGVISFVAGMSNGSTGIGMLMLVAYAVVIPIFLRIYFEFVLVLFCIHDKLDKLVQK